MQTKKLQKYILKYETCLVVFWWAVFMLLEWCMVYEFHAQNQMIPTLAGGCAILVVLVVCTFLHARVKSREIIQGIEREAGNIESENFIACSVAISVSEHCFIYHHGEKIVALLKENIQAVYFDGKNIIIDVKDKNGILRVPCSAEVNNALQKWMS